MKHKSILLLLILLKFKERGTLPHNMQIYLVGESRAELEKTIPPLTKYDYIMVSIAGNHPRQDAFVSMQCHY